MKRTIAVGCVMLLGCGGAAFSEAADDAASEVAVDVDSGIADGGAADEGDAGIDVTGDLATDILLVMDVQTAEREELDTWSADTWTADEPPPDAPDEQPVSPCPTGVACICQGGGPMCPGNLPYYCAGNQECCNWRPSGC